MKKYKENEEHREAYQRERRAAGVTKSKNTVSSIENVGSGDGSDETATVTAQQFSGMFGAEGPADLAIARKMRADVSGGSV
jgi:hypothetical protein